MLALRPSCENCNKSLPNGSKDAMICTYECTFCKDCVKNVMKNVCPNCGGGFEKRPTRPKVEIEKNPAQTEVVFKPVQIEKLKKLQEQYQNIKPRKR